MTDGSYSVDGLQALFNSERAGVDGHLVDKLVEFINDTRTRLDCAIYDLRDPDVLRALAGIAAEGKQLRIVYDAGGQHRGDGVADPKPGLTQQAIENAGLARYAVGLHLTGRHLMHDKFLVRDGETVWTGSANFTEGGLVLQDNNCLVLDAPTLAQSYTKVFEDLLSAPEKLPAAAPSESLSVGPTTINAYFEPPAREGTDALIARLLNQARKVRIMAFLISDPDILQALRRFQDREADIAGVYDPGGMDDARRASNQDPNLFWFCDDDRFVAAHSHPFSPTRENDFMHNKVMIIDDHLVITGSYNFSENAETNYENLLLLDSPDLSQVYTDYFDAVYREAKAAA